jgi:predicted flavoprotein YhiN
MLFTSKGISGPIALSLSSYINKYDKVDLSIDFKPALSHEKLLSRIERDIENLRESVLKIIETFKEAEEYDDELKFHYEI